ncbi:MAG: hypothetical protein HKP10_01835 [Kiritimatiellales bacterium]|nr:hypothetical protein [Kiritimatiellales bacterium]
MNFKALNKGQKQNLILSSVAAVVLLCLTVLGIRFSLSSVAKAREELMDLSSKINTADNVLSKSSHTSEDYDSSVRILRECLDKIPPERDYYSWASQVIYATARTSGMEVDTVDEMNTPASKVDGNKETVGFRSYSLRITARGGYTQTKNFLSRLEHDQPLVRFSGMEISSGSSPDTHNVQLFIQWPFNLSKLEAVWDEVATKQKAIARQSGYRHQSAESGLDRNGPEETDGPRSETRPPTDSPKAPDGSDINSFRDEAKYARLDNNAKRKALLHEQGIRKRLTAKASSSRRTTGGYR